MNVPMNRVRLQLLSEQIKIKLKNKIIELVLYKTAKT